MLAATHDVAGALGLSPGSAGAWLLAVLLLVVAVRTVLLPVTIHGVRSSHARAHAAPQLRELRQRYAGSRDLEQLTAMRAEQKAIHAEHGVSGWSLAPALLQLPLFYALYRVVSDLTAGHSVGALDAGLVASASAASLAGLHLTSHLGTTLGSNPVAGLVLVAVAVGAAALSLLTQRWFVLPMTDPHRPPRGDGDGPAAPAVARRGRSAGRGGRRAGGPRRLLVLQQRLDVRAAGSHLAVRPDAGLTGGEAT